MDYIIEAKANNYENIELDIRKECTELKIEFGPKIISELSQICNYFLLSPKSKKENGIIKEKMMKDILVLLKSNKQFKSSENIFANIRYLAVYDTATREIGKVVSIDPINLELTYYTYIDGLNKKPHRVKKWSELMIFDYNSFAQMEVIQRLYTNDNQKGLTYLENYCFLAGKGFQTKSTINEQLDLNKGYGVELSPTEIHPIIKQVMVEYKIPTNAIIKPKRQLHKLDSETLEILEVYDSVTDAFLATGISSSTISNVLCAGASAEQYEKAGGFKWEYSTIPNVKYRK